MKKLFLLPILFFLMACGGGSGSKTEEPKKEEAKSEDLSKNPDYQKGLELIAKNDCFTCHQIDDKLNGQATNSIHPHRARIGRHRRLGHQCCDRRWNAAKCRSAQVHRGISEHRHHAVPAAH